MQIREAAERESFKEYESGTWWRVDEKASLFWSLAKLWPSVAKWSFWPTMAANFVKEKKPAEIYAFFCRQEFLPPKTAKAAAETAGEIFPRRRFFGGISWGPFLRCVLEGTRD